MMRVYDHNGSPPSVIAERWLVQALDDVQSGRDAIPAVTAALAALRIEAGEVPTDELADLALGYSLCTREASPA